MLTYLYKRQIYSIAKVTAPFSHFTVCFLVTVTVYYFMVGCTSKAKFKSESECQILREEFAAKSCHRL